MESLYFMKITCFLSLCYFSFANAVDFLEKITVPVEIHDSFSNAVYVKNFEIKCVEHALEVVVSQFCTEFDLHKVECALLHDHIISRYEDDCQIQQSISSASIEHETDSLDYVANALPHLLRHSKAVHAELGSFLRSERDFIVAADVEDYQLGILMKEVNDSLSIVKTVAYLHSCTLPGGDNSVLHDMLLKINESGLIHHIDKLWVLNYGEEIDIEIQHKFSFVKFIQMYSDTSFFELPTIRIIQLMAQNFNRIYDHNVRILYLHTKGVSYKETYQQIVDWRDMMMYFLVEKHESNFHLLDSEMFDAIGSNYYTLPKRHFDGNFWWSTAKYVQCLEPLSLRIHKKYDAEYWLLGSRGARVFIHHMSSLYHGTEEYARELYAYEDDKVTQIAAKSKDSSNGIEGTCASYKATHLSMCVHLPAVRALQ